MGKLANRVGSHLKTHNMEYQFWLYETGNVNAAVAGAGGYKKVIEDFRSVAVNTDYTTWQKMTTLAADYPDATVAVSIGGLVVAAPALKKAAGTVTQKMNGLIDAGATIGSAAILGYAVSQDSSWITISASSFVVGSSFLKYAAQNPFFLKLGGLGLAAGGTALAAFGAETIESTKLTLPLLTVASGAYITSASFLTYEGGMYQTEDWKAKNPQPQTPRGWVSKLTHPTKGMLSRAFESYVDGPVQAINNVARKTMLTYIPKKTRDTKPFWTSMWARVPWRILTGAAAIITGDYAFAASNAQWAGGDVMIGLEDLNSSNEKKDEPDFLQKSEPDIA